MNERTQLHLRTASTNREYALAILLDDDTSTTELNRAAVAAFYVAMHAINAYLWEIARLEPVNHRDRHDIIARWPTLQPLRSAYNALFEFSISARYVPGYAVSRADLDTLVARHLARVMATVEHALPDDK